MGLFSLFNKKKKIELKAYLSGRLIHLEDVNDGVFSKKMMGEGIAIKPTSNELLAPADGEVIVIMDKSFHAVGLKLKDQTEVLLHIGIDTVYMNGEGFTPHVKVGDHVKTGQKLITFDRDKIKKAGYRDVTVLAITQEGNQGSIHFIEPICVNANDTIISQL